MNILIIGGNGSEPDANSVCVRNMTKEFIAQGHRMWLIAMGDVYTKEAGMLDGAELWHVPSDYYRDLTRRVEIKNNRSLIIWHKIVSVVRHILLLFTYPITSPFRTIKLFRLSKRLVEENRIDVVITIFNPFDNIFCGMKLKRLFGEKLRVVSYHLDLRTASINNSVLVRNYIYKHALKSLIRENHIVDRVLVPYSGKKDLKTLRGLDMAKISFVGFPVYISSTNSPCACNAPFEKDAINISYIGSLSVVNRNPKYILSLLEEVCNIINRRIIVHFWGDTGGLNNLLNNSPISVYHGMIDNKYVRYLMDNSDFLLNLGNTLAYDMLPSKVFSMFATGKPIINLIGHPLDSTLPFFERYNHSIDIREYQHDKCDAITLADGILSMINTQRLATDGLFEDFKPSTICDAILMN